MTTKVAARTDTAAPDRASAVADFPRAARTLVLPTPEGQRVGALAEDAHIDRDSELDRWADTLQPLTQDESLEASPSLDDDAIARLEPARRRRQKIVLAAVCGLGALVFVLAGARAVSRAVTSRSFAQAHSAMPIVATQPLLSVGPAATTVAETAAIQPPGVTAATLPVPAPQPTAKTTLVEAKSRPAVAKPSTKTGLRGSRLKRAASAG